MIFKAIETKSGRLLVVDDEIDSLTPLCDLLSEWGYEVTGYASGKEALEALKEKEFDLLLTDLVMPEMDGIELIHAVMKKDPHLVSIIITGKGTIQTAVEAMKTGAFDYLLKPIEWKLLKPVLSRAMEVRRLREAEEKYRSVVEDYQTELICRFLPDGTLTFVNEVCCRYFKKTYQELVGRTFQPFIPEQDYEALKRHSAAMNVNNPVSTVEHRVIAPDGEIRWLRWTHRAIFNEQGRIIEFQSLGRDITDRKQAEEKIRYYQKQLRSLASELSLTEERERRLLAIELHDNIGQTLAIAKIKLGALRESVSSPGLLERVNEIHNLIEQTIQNTRALTFELSPPILYELGFGPAIEWLAEQIRDQHGIQIDFEDDRKPRPMSDETRALLFKSVRELLINVIKHAQARNAKVSIRSDGDDMRIDVEDDGIGFYARESGSDQRSIGFGLFSIRERLEHLGGRLKVESDPGRGTRITMVLPLRLEKKSAMEINGYKNYPG